MARNKEHLPELLFHTAKGFYEIAFNCAHNIKKNNDIESFQLLAPAAVNFSFAVELFLKGLISMTTKKPIRGHHIKSLFLELPSEVRIKIEDRYKYQLHNNKAQEYLSSYAIVVSIDNKSSRNDKRDKSSTTILELLESHNKAFENWRYIHEIGEVGYDYEFDFKLMDCFLKAVIDVINNTPNRPNLGLVKA
jgi:HEPN domain-containing protein